MFCSALTFLPLLFLASSNYKMSLLPVSLRHTCQCRCSGRTREANKAWYHCALWLTVVVFQGHLNFLYLFSGSLTPCPLLQRYFGVRIQQRSAKSCLKTNPVSGICSACLHISAISWKIVELSVYLRRYSQDADTFFLEISKEMQTALEENGLVSPIWQNICLCFEGIRYKMFKFIAKVDSFCNVDLKAPVKEVTDKQDIKQAQLIQPF